MMNDFKSRQFVLFLITGGFAALVNFISRFFYNTHMSFGSAVIVAYITGMITAFVLSKVFVFKQSKHSTQKEFLLFSLVNVVAIIQTYVISIALGEYFFPRMEFHFYPMAVAHAVGVIFPVFTSFIGHKYFSFKGSL